VQKRQTYPSIFFIGLMAAGKTSVGRAVARRLDWPFFDSDHEIVARTGAQISLIFDIEGEAGFRAREAQVIAELTQRPAIVLATGGGAILSAANRRHLRERGLVIYLNVAPHELWQRTRHDKNRPLLQAEDQQARLARLLILHRERDPLYRECAHIIIESKGTSLHRLVDTVYHALCTMPLNHPSLDNAQGSQPPEHALTIRS
jgi:shikimate kinase